MFEKKRPDHSTATQNQNSANRHHRLQWAAPQFSLSACKSDNRHVLRPYIVDVLTDWGSLRKLSL